MKKSVINQFEKTLRYEFSCWEDMTIEREDTKAWTTFLIEDEDNTTMYKAPIKKAINITESYNLTYGTDDVCFVIETKTCDGGWTKPVIKILISVG